MRVEYKIRPVVRYVVTRWHEAEPGTIAESMGGVETKGEFDNHGTAYAVAYALAKEEHSRLGYPVGDERIKYPDECRPSEQHLIT